MKRALFLVLFIIFIGGVFAQTSAENRWVLGTWEFRENHDVGEYDEWTWTFNDNGTGRWQIAEVYRSQRYEETVNFLFSINGTELYLFIEEEESLYLEVLGIHRINDRRMIIIDDWGDVLSFTKR